MNSSKGKLIMSDAKGVIEAAAGQLNDLQVIVDSCNEVEVSGGDAATELNEVGYSFKRAVEGLKEAVGENRAVAFDKIAPGLEDSFALTEAAAIMIEAGAEELSRRVSALKKGLFAAQEALGAIDGGR